MAARNPHLHMNSYKGVESVDRRVRPAFQIAVFPLRMMKNQHKTKILGSETYSSVLDVTFYFSYILSQYNPI
jgi:hypothetical protein